MFSPKEILCFCGIDELTLSSFSSAFEVGVGLYLGLAILQVIGSGGMADLTRRSSTLEKTINTNSLHGIRNEYKRIDADLAKLHITLHGFSRLVFSAVLILLLVCLGILATSSLFPDYAMSCWSAFTVLGHFLLLPVLLFVGSTYWIRRKCASVRSAIKTCEQHVTQKLMEKA